MTRDEAIKYLRQIYPNGDHCWLDSQRIEAIEMATMALSKPSLPSNLDEVAEDSSLKYSIKLEESGITASDSVHYRTGFKSGAEWMAGQFVLVGGALIGWFRANDGGEYATGLDLIEPIKLPVDFYVRKK